jgi:hypothetical protein
MIEDFGGRLASVWSGLRPATRGLVERAMQARNTTVPKGNVNTSNLPYDSRADRELSLLLSALDERVTETDLARQRDDGKQLRQIAETCAAVLQEKTQSAEVFTQLIRRADGQRDYARIDALADALRRFSPTEVCELARSEDAVVKALANEALAQFPTSVLIGLLSDPVDSDIAREALRRQALEYGSEEARQIVSALDQMNLTQDDI